MPLYSYRAITKNGQEVRNKVEDSSRMSLIKKLKRNNLMPINVVQVSLARKAKNSKKGKNINNMQSVLKKVNTTDMANKRAVSKVTLKEKVSIFISRNNKITTRDVMIFTQNFYLLKKANFNNIHALNTIIESTENLSFRGVLEDILVGVEARREHVYNNGILYKYISIYIYKYGKSRRIISVH